MRATARIAVARCADGSTRVVDARSEPPLAVRRCGERILVVSSAAAPVGGDELALALVAGDGAVLCAGTAAATVVWPGRGGEHSATTTELRAGRDAHVEWRPEPLVSVAGSHHVARTSVDLDERATCTVVEEVALGRSGEPCGRLALDLTVRRSGHTIVRHTELLGPGTPGWGSTALVGAARHVAAAVVVGPPAGRAATQLDGDGTSAAWLPIDAVAALALAVGADRPRAVAALARVAPGGLRRWASEAPA